MILKRLLFSSSAAAVLALTSSVRAASSADGPDSSPPPRSREASDDVAMTAGTGIGTISSIGALGATQPSLSAGLELRLFDHLWLIGRAQGSYDGGPGYDAWSVGGALGPRLVFNPNDRIQASTFVTLGASTSFFDVEGDEFKTFVGEAEAGPTVDIGIISGVGLRLSSALVRISRAFQSDSNPSTSLQVGLRPEIQVRVSF